MARARNIKPRFFTNELLAEVPPLARLLFQGLWCVADRAGRLADRPKRLKAELLPYDDCDVNELLDALALREFILRYAVHEDRFIQVTNFCKHQNPHHKEAQSTIPAPGLPGVGTDPVPTQPQTSNGEALLIPDCPLLDPDPRSSDFFTPTTDCLGSATSLPLLAERATPGEVKTENPPDRRTAIALTAEAFCVAYQKRYGVEFQRNAQAMGLFKSLVKIIGADNAPAVSMHFVASNNRYYVEPGHHPRELVGDAQKLYAELKTGRLMTAAQARQIDGTQTRGIVWSRVKERVATNGERHD